MRNRILVPYPSEVIAEIDQVVPRGKRAAFLVELAKRELKLRRQRDALRACAGAWKSEDHPELAQGSAAWVRQIRSEGADRDRQIEEHRRSG